MTEIWQCKKSVLPIVAGICQHSELPHPILHIWGSPHGLTVACCITDHYHPCSNLGVGIWYLIVFRTPAGDINSHEGIYLVSTLLSTRPHINKNKKPFFKGSAFVWRCSPMLCSWTAPVYSVYTTKLSYSQPQIRPSFICRWHPSIHIFIYSRHRSFSYTARWLSQWYL